MDDVGNANPLALSASQVGIRRSYGFGSSSTGMYMRDWLYLGFNEDESLRKVFDAVNVHIAGTHRLFANVEFADPNTYSELEYYEFRASLNLHDGLGKAVEFPENVRSYLISNFQHGGGNPPTTFPVPSALCAYPTNPNYQGPTHRALLVAMDLWADRGVEPPDSRVPSVRQGTLVTLDEQRRHFPSIPGVQFPPFLNELKVLDFGPLFGPRGGVLTVLPPLQGASYQVLVPETDEDGLDVAGIRPMEVRVPLGTNTGWNVRAAGRRAPNLCGLSGSWFPFTSTKGQRLASGDPRRSLEERYHDHDGYVRAVERTARDMVRERLLLQEDADRMIAAARASTVLQ